MVDVSKKVETHFTIEHAQAVSALGQLSTSFASVGGVIGRVSSLVSPLNIALGSIGAGLSFAGITKIGSEFEQLQIGMAQTLKFMGAGGHDFSQAMENAALVLKRIRADAGPLPGEAEDYAKAMQLAGAVTQSATGDFEKSYALIRDMSAISIAIGGTAQLGAVEINRLLAGARGMMRMQSDYSLKILAAMRQLPGQANLTSREFNKMDLPKRLELLTAMTHQFDDMVKTQMTTWEAVKGAATSTMKILFQGTTSPLFEAAKSTVLAMNNALMQTNGEFTVFGQQVFNVGKAISKGIIEGFSFATELIGEAASAIRSIVGSDSFARLTNIGISVYEKATSKQLGPAQTAFQAGTGDGSSFGDLAGSVGVVSSALALLSGTALPLVPVFGVISVAISNLAQNATFISTVFERTVNLMGALTQVVGPLSEYFGAVGNILSDFVSTILPPVISTITAIVEPLGFFFQQMLSIATTIVSVVRPALSSLWSSIGNLVDSIGSFLNPVIRILGSVITFVYDRLSGLFIPIITEVASWFTALIDTISDIIRVAGSFLSGFADMLDKDRGIASSRGRNYLEKDTSSIAQWWRNLLQGDADSKNKSLRGMSDVKTPPNTGGGGRTVQDFRYSRFDITQKFAEGFDPDRIAIAFAKDIGKIGEQRLQSAHEPYYSLGG